MLACGWAEARQTAGVSVAVIPVNSLAGHAGIVTSVRELPAYRPSLLAAAGLGGFSAAALGSRELGHGALRRARAVVPVIAGLKLLFTR